MDKEQIELPGDYPEPTKGDMGITAMRTLIAAVPYVGGSVDEVLGLALQSPVQKRRDKWFRGVGAALEELAKRGKAPKLEELLEDERFVTATIQATRIAVGTHRGEKRRFLRNVLTSLACGKGTSEEMWGVFFRYIEEFGAPHIMLLKLFDNDERRARSGHCGTFAQYIIEGLGKPARNPYYYQFGYAIVDLNTRGLITLRDMGEKFTQDAVITPYGRHFLEFIADHEPAAGE
jgi:hypothetical protein